jgi:hypothetical protein
MATRFLVVVLIVTWLAGVAGAQKSDRGCPTDSMPAGPVCVDKFEASIWHTTNARLIGKIKQGTVILADLTAANAIQLGASSDDYATVGCQPNGNGCGNIYAVSIAGVKPSRFMTWFQATTAARNSGKRLLTNAEWQTAALGTPDTGLVIGADDCNTFGFGGADLTGARSNCVSSVGIFDMVGNVAEWVADWVVRSVDCNWSPFSDDTLCITYATTNTPLGFARGGAFDEGAGGRDAGPFSGGSANLSIGSQYVGFRATR